MNAWLRKTLTLSETGARDLVQACLACTLYNLLIIAPMGLIYLFLRKMFEGLERGIFSGGSVLFCILASLALIAVSFAAAMWQYNSCFTNAYKECRNTRIALAEKLRKLPLSFFGNRDLSDLTTAIMTDAAGLETGFSHYIPELAGALFSLLLCSIGLFFMDPVMTLSVLWVVPAAFTVMAFGKKFLDRVNERGSRNRVQRADLIQEYIDNIKEIKADNQAEKYLGRLDDMLKSQVRETIFQELSNAAVVNSAGFLLKLALATAVICGSGRLISGKTDALTFIVFMIAATRLLAPVEACLINMAAMYNTMIQVRRMKEIYGQEEQTGADEITCDGYDIVFDHVGFSYHPGEKAVQDVSFTARQGEITALIGPSGGGKSTCARLAARFWDPDQGTITVGGADISKVNPELLLKNYSIVFQDVLLFDATVLDNIRLGRLGATDREVLDAARAAGCDEFAARLPEGYHTLIGENGCRLSGGERQRISIARAILKDAPIVLLDEATASLDVENETKVQEALSVLLKGKTVLIIAHRMRTVANADHLIVLDGGRVAEEGKPKELLKRGGIYSRMAGLQEESAAWEL